MIWLELGNHSLTEAVMDVRCRVRSWIDTGSWASRMLCGSCRRQLGRLSRDERGAVAVLLGIMIAVSSSGSKQNIEIDRK